jgi:predicted nucleotidyltransferase
MKNSRTIDPTTRRSIDLLLARMAGQYPIAEAWLYGSRARGDGQPDSDADVAIILNGPKGRSIQVATEMAGPEFDVLQETGVLVSAFPIWIEDWRNPSGHSNPWLIANIKREGIRL